MRKKNVSVNEKNEKTGDTLLMCAAKYGYADTVQYLITQHANVYAENNDGETAAILAAMRGQTETLEILINNGVDVNARNEKTGANLLMYAISEGKVDTIQYLINRGANVNERYGEIGHAEAMYAAMRGDTETLGTLIDNGVDVNATNKMSGNTLLLYATMHEQTETMQYLINRGAHLSASNNNGYTVDTYAAMTYNWKITQIIDETRKYPGAKWVDGCISDDYDMAIRVRPAPEANHRAGGINGLIGVNLEGHQGGENQRHDGNGLELLGCGSTARLPTAFPGAGNQGNRRDNGNGVGNP